ncbi:MAG TPA: histidine kinase dimerization/phosphoacceptor domain -containing protein [Sphingomicrobium sp.]|nr:histidine kinase dimerization/phosphoacceptor domain -containing protein [Sphingomicrobium sp.]
MRSGSLFGRLPTGALLLLLLTAALLPLGLVLAWAANGSTEDAGKAHVARAEQRGLVAARAIDGLIFRNVEALKVAANGALASGATDPCAATSAALAITPRVAPRMRLRDSGGKILCSVGGFRPERNDLNVAPGHTRLWVSPQHSIYFRAGIIGGSATGTLTAQDIHQVYPDILEGFDQLVVHDGATGLAIVNRSENHRQLHVSRRYPIADGQLSVRTVVPINRSPLIDRLLMFLPLLMWIVAAVLSWLVVRRLLLQPLARLQRAVTDYQPGDQGLELPTELGPTPELRELCQAFERAVNRIEGVEREAVEAYEGQRRLVREVHHRVKNNLQVVASLLSIHGRSALKPEAKAAYSAIGRRVDALSVVHRNHFAEMEESRGIALRPLLTELAAGLRASAPTEARAMSIVLEIDPAFTTQDNAVAATFLITEIVEFAMLRQPGDPVEIELRRVDQLTATLIVTSSVLVPAGETDDAAKIQFERIVEGLARQLRSPLDRRLGRYGVTLPVFPEDRA